MNNYNRLERALSNLRNMKRNPKMTKDEENKAAEHIEQATLILLGTSEIDLAIPSVVAEEVSFLKERVGALEERQRAPVAE